MRRALVVLAAVGLGVVIDRAVTQLTASAQEDCAPLQVYTPVGGEPDVYIQDMDGDGGFDAITEAVHILRWFFAGGPAPVRPCTSSSSGVGLPDTGQTTCYDEVGGVIDCTSETCAGQDSFYQAGCTSEGRLVDNGDGTVTDNCTGLMWQKDTRNDGNYLAWCNALAYCENLELAGHDDWRLPNVREIQSIVDYGRYIPSIDPVFDVVWSSYWSSTSVAGNPGYAWGVYFPSGHVDYYGKFYDHFVRAVRTIQSGE